ncbi:MAG: hypothetical protein WCQ16_02830 [Verrucomicrobiae bacterium]
MATIKSTLADYQDNERLDQRAPGSLLFGKVSFAQCSFTTTATTAAADVLRLCKLPAGAIVIPGLSFISTEDCGMDISLKIGDDDATPDDDRYSTAVSLATAGRIAFASGVAGANPFALVQESWIQAVVVDAGSISVTAGQDLTVWIAFRHP